MKILAIWLQKDSLENYAENMHVSVKMYVGKSTQTNTNFFYT